MGESLPYSREHGPAVRAKIVDAASRLMLEKGMSVVSIATVMENVGLTHGGFYLHFKSKQDLVDNSIARAVRQTNDQIRLWLHDKRENGLKTIVQSYLSQHHRDEPVTGCPLPAVGADIARTSIAARRAVSCELETMIGLIAEQYKGLSRETARRQATAAVATMVGTILLARATNDPVLSDSIMTAGRRSVLDAAAGKARRGSGRPTGADRRGAPPR
jgi:TetR/AcrR family transcriptional repressor of nem operon